MIEHEVVFIAGGGIGFQLVCACSRRTGLYPTIAAALDDHQDHADCQALAVLDEVV